MMPSVLFVIGWEGGLVSSMGHRVGGRTLSVVFGSVGDETLSVVCYNIMLSL